VSEAWATWTPSLEASAGDLDLGRGARRTGTWTRHGRLVVAEFSIRFGADPEPGRGTFLLVPPVPPRAIDDVPRRVGSATVGDQSDGVRHLHVSVTANAVIDDRRFLFSTDGRAATGELLLSHEWPWSWAEDDFLVGQLSYEAAR
jgi:hypothetical protein